MKQKTLLQKVLVFFGIWKTHLWITGKFIENDKLNEPHDFHDLIELSNFVGWYEFMNTNSGKLSIHTVEYYYCSRII